MAVTCFCMHEFTKPPRFALLFVPPFILIIMLFLIKPGRKFIDNLNIRQLTSIHTIRVFVEAVLYWLFVVKTIPQVMTFAGYNFDVLAGLSAPVVYYIIFIKGRFSKTALIAWNIISVICY